MQTIQMPELICQRCNHKWTPRNARVYLCPKCHSPKWDEPIEQKVVTETEVVNNDAN
jgi:Zn finger protein HypA/HybF involved in hydrogenase expression